MIPTRGDLLEAYESLQNPNSVLVPEDIVVYSELSRFDPRLAELVVRYIVNKYDQLNPIEMRKFNSQSKWPQGLCVLIEIGNLLVSKTNQDWMLWKKCIQADVKPIAFQSFFIGLDSINPGHRLKQIERNLKCFAKWGFYNDEIPISEKNHKIEKTLLTKSQRQEILRQLIREKKTFTVTDYIEALGNRIHRRQAERDINEIGGVQSIGHTRGRRYRAV